MHPGASTILLVEDHHATRAFLADNLSADGYELLEADCAAQAEQLIETGFPDLAIIDLGLPDRDGLELVARVRGGDGVASRADPDLPILLLTGRTGELDRLRGFQRGADDYLCKPAYAVVCWGAGNSSRRSTGKMISPSNSFGAALRMAVARGCGSM
jgi:DNA-binding response OmpR family regulator